ncbi:MAG: response regulator [Nitrospirales bacterium]|nr:response regulator [Nitrospira sp.]MDR4501613.1 response regulator [Nitrospirales bacterium]
MKRLLIVDDEQDHRLVLQDMLQSHDYMCDEANDGIMAAEKLLRYSYDLVVTDCNMPRMDGLQLIDYMSDHPSLRTLPVILVTGVMPCLSARVRGNTNLRAVHTKPYDIKRLLASIAKASHEAACEIPLAG